MYCKLDFCLHYPCLLHVIEFQNGTLQSLAFDLNALRRFLIYTPVSLNIALYMEISLLLSIGKSFDFDD